MASVVLDGVTVRRGGGAVLRDLDLTVADGSLTAIVGEAASGKTTVLRVIAGLDRPTAGRVLIGGVDVGAVATEDRNVAMAFQRPALYPTRTVRANIAFPLELRHDAIEQIRERVGAEARALHIERLLTARPDRLSEGERHAVQIARALIRQPAVLLLDEPFATIDDVWTDQLRRELRLLRGGFGTTTVMATNDPLDAMTADAIAVLEAGRITQAGTPIEVYAHPRSAAAATATGAADVLEIDVDADPSGNGWWLRHRGFELRSRRPVLADHVGRRLEMVTRPEWWQLDPNGPVRASVERVLWGGPVSSARCRIGGELVTVRLDEGATPRVDRVLGLRIADYVLLDPDTGRAIW